MKQFIKAFVLRGLLAASGGPVILAIIYGIIGQTGAVSSLTPQEVCLAILTITLLAFVVAGMTAVYQVEQLPLPLAILIHGGVLYGAYILVYLINGWLQDQLIPILVFTGIFLANYAIIWLVIYLVTKSRARRINAILQAKE